MSDYPLWAYRAQLEQKARNELGYDHPLQDQKRNHAIKVAIDEKVQERAQQQAQSLNKMVKNIKEGL